MSRQFSKAEESLNLLLDDNHWKDPLAKTMLGLAIMLKVMMPSINPVLAEWTSKPEISLAAPTLCFMSFQAGKKDSSSEKDHIQTLLNEGAQEHDSVKIYGMLATVLRRAGEAGEAERVYDAGLQNGLFLSKWQRSASNSKFNFR